MTAPRKMATPSLAGLLQTRPAAAVDTDEDVPDAPRAARVAATKTTGRTAGPTTTPSPREAGADAPPSRGDDAGPTEPQVYRRSITVYLPRDLHRRVGVAAQSAGITRTALMLEAVNRTHRKLGPVLKRAQAPATGQDLFAVPQARAATEPSMQTTLRVTDEQYAALESLADAHTVNRSRIVATALRLYLDAT